MTMEINFFSRKSEPKRILRMTETFDQGEDFFLIRFVFNLREFKIYERVKLEFKILLRLRF